MKIKYLLLIAIVAALPACGGAATPAEALVEVATDLRDHGVVRRAWLGVRAVDLDPAAATVLAVAGGARITRVSPDSPAADAGLEVDDVVVAVGDLEVDDASDLVVALRAHEPGDQVSVQYRRGATSASCTAVLAG